MKTINKYGLADGIKLYAKQQKLKIRRVLAYGYELAPKEKGWPEEAFYILWSSGQHGYYEVLLSHMQIDGGCWSKRDSWSRATVSVNTWVMAELIHQGFKDAHKNNDDPNLDHFRR